MFHIVLYEPEIPPNTGNILRLCANTGCQLHLIEPLGFSLDDKPLRRAGLDYIQRSTWLCYDNWQAFEEYYQATYPDARLFYCTTKTKKRYTEFAYKKNDFFVFGPESRGLPETLLQANTQQTITIPMLKTGRSLNLATAVSIVIYEAWRQWDFG